MEAAPEEEKKEITNINDFFSEFIASGKILFEENPTAKWLLPGALIRFGGYFCILFYAPIAITKAYPENIDQFSTLYALIEIFVANGSAIFAGYLSDKLEKDTYWAKPAIVIGSSLIAAPLIITGLLNQDNFNFTMTMIFFSFIFSQAFEAPLITMIQNTTPVRI